MMSLDKTGVIFLAAGKSSRFMKTSTFPKGLYPVFKTTWLEYMMKNFSQFHCIVITGQYHQLFAKHLDHLKNQLIYNEDHELGSFSSLYKGLESLKKVEQVFIMPVDGGVIEKQTIDILFQQDDKFDVVVSQFRGKGGHPVLLRKNFITHLLSLDKTTARLDFAIRDYDQNKVKRVECFDSGVCVNLNTEAQLLTYLELIQQRDLRIDHMGKQAGSLSLIEIGLGSFLHGFKVPLSGQFLSLNQGFFLTRTACRLDQFKGKKTDPALISGITATLKSLSPAGKKLTPMLALAMQGNLYSLGLFILGNNFFGRCLGMALLSLWSFIQPFGLYLLLFGKELPFMFEYYLQKLQKFFSFSTEYLWWVVIAVISVKLILGLVCVLVAHKISEAKVKSFEQKMLSLGLKNQFQKKVHGPAWKLALKDLCHPFFLFSLILSAIFFIYAKSDWSERIWFLLRPLALGYLFFYFSRKINLISLSDKMSKGSFPLFGKALGKALAFLGRR